MDEFKHSDEELETDRFNTKYEPQTEKFDTEKFMNDMEMMHQE
jgi:hypothetical protein